jgi:hypothetical protein
MESRQVNNSARAKCAERPVTIEIFVRHISIYDMDG